MNVDLSILTHVLAVIGSLALILAGFFLLGYRWPRLGVLLGVIVSAGWLAAMIWLQDRALAMFALPLASALMGAMAASRPSTNSGRAERVEARASDWTYRLGRAAWYLFLVVLLIGGLVGAILGVSMIYGPFLVLLLAGALIRYSLISRDTLATYVFSTIGSSMRQNLPLATAMELEASSQVGKRRRVMLGVGRWLTEGQPLSEALRRGYGSCPGYALALFLPLKYMIDYMNQRVMP